VELRNELGTMIHACRLQSVNLKKLIALPLSLMPHSKIDCLGRGRCRGKGQLGTAIRV
jgi:hypothetical protein